MKFVYNLNKIMLNEKENRLAFHFKCLLQAKYNKTITYNCVVITLSLVGSHA